MKRILSFTLVVAVILAMLMPVSAFAATVGQSLTAPETGWQRIDDRDPNFYWSGNPGQYSAPGWYNDTDTGGYLYGTKFVFYFYGTEVRIIGGIYSNKSNNISVKIDGISYGSYSQYSASRLDQVVLYEKTGLSSGLHAVEVTNDNTSQYWMELDAIDIDSSGSIVGFEPTNLKTTSGDNQTTLNWNPVQFVTGYNVKRSTTPGGPYTTIAKNVTSATYYTDTTVNNGSTYYYVVSSLVNGVESSNSHESSSTPISVPTAPTGLTAASGNAQVNLTWNSVTWATYYVLERSTTSGGPYTMISSNITGTSFVDSGVNNGTTYYYVVKAVNEQGASGNSNEASVTPQPPVVERAILKISLTSGLEKEFDLSMSEINSFISWYEAKEAGNGQASYAIDKHNNNIGPFKSRKNYIIYDQIMIYEVDTYTSQN